MAEKLSEAAWTGYVKKQKLELDDKALVKVLAAYDKTDDDKPEPRLKALDDVIKQIPEQVKLLVKRKKELGDKPFGEAKDKLYALLEEAEGLQKKTRAAAAAAAAAAATEKDDEEEADTPVLLTTRMIPLLRELRKGEAQMHAMICTAGKNTAVLIMRRAISPSRRKLLAEAVDAKGGMKYIVGACQFENKALTFVVQSPAAQLAKRIRQALLEQTEMRFKVKVRGDDGVEENDGEDESEEQPAAEAKKQAAPPGGPASAEQTLYVQRLRKVRERYEQALSERHPEANKLRAVMGYASEKADGQKDYAAASKALEQLERILGAPTAGAQAPKEPAGVDAGVAFKARMTALIPKIKEAEAGGHPSAAEAKRKAGEAGVLAGKRNLTAAQALLDEVEKILGAASARGAATPAPGPGTAAVPFDEANFRRQWAAAKTSWQDAVETVDAQIAKLQVVLRTLNDRELTQIADKGLNGVTGNFKVPLMAAVMDIDRARGEGLRKASQKGLRAARAFAKYLTTEETVRVTDENAFGVPVTIRASLGKALRDIDAALSPLV